MLHIIENNNEYLGAVKVEALRPNTSQSMVVKSGNKPRQVTVFPMIKRGGAPVKMATPIKVAVAPQQSPKVVTTPMPNRMVAPVKPAVKPQAQVIKAPVSVDPLKNLLVPIAQNNSNTTADVVRVSVPPSVNTDNVTVNTRTNANSSNTTDPSSSKISGGKIVIYSLVGLGIVIAGYALMNPGEKGKKGLGCPGNKEPEKVALGGVKKARKSHKKAAKSKTINATI